MKQSRIINIIAAIINRANRAQRLRAAETDNKRASRIGNKNQPAAHAIGAAPVSR